MTRWLYLCGNEEIGQWKGLRKEYWELRILYLLWEIFHLKKSLYLTCLKSRIYKSTQDRIQHRTTKTLKLRKCADTGSSVFIFVLVSTWRQILEMVNRKFNYFHNWCLLIIEEFPWWLSYVLECWYERHLFIQLHRWNQSFSSSWLIMLHYFIWKMLSIKAIVMGSLIRQTLLENTI